MNPALGLQQFRSDGCLSYCVYDTQAREAVIIDPELRIVNEYREFLADNRLKLVRIVDTHSHADHFSASHQLRAGTGARIAMSDRTTSRRADDRLAHGSRFSVASLGFQALHTPGHTPDSLSLGVEGLLFTGDTLLIGSTGRADFQGADPEAHYDSLHKILGALPDSTLVYPGHDYGDRLFSRLGVERKTNPHLLIPSRELFVELKRSERLAHPTREIQERLDFNAAGALGEAVPGVDTGGGPAAACGVQQSSTERPATMGARKYAPKLEEAAPGSLFVDVREPDEFAEGHIPGTVNIPLSRLGLELDKLFAAKRIYLSCRSGTRSSRAARTLAALGHTDVVDIEGGIRGWQQAGFPVEK